VEDLHLQGFSTAEIAHRLGLHPTEVKMALELGRLKPK
jgi:DNA-directed RNA polymerase specialized sigma24 family protein